jgi:hypothetical protein
VSGAFKYGMLAALMIFGKARTTIPMAMAMNIRPNA